MELNEIKEKVIDIVFTLFKDQNIDKDLIEHVNLVSDMNMESIIFISLIVNIENEFLVIIPDEFLLMDYFRTIDDIVFTIVNRCISQNKA